MFPSNIPSAFGTSTRLRLRLARLSSPEPPVSVGLLASSTISSQADSHSGMFGICTPFLHKTVQLYVNVCIVWPCWIRSATTPSNLQQVHTLNEHQLQWVIKAAGTHARRVNTCALLAWVAPLALHLAPNLNFRAIKITIAQSLFPKLVATIQRHALLKGVSFLRDA